MPTKASSNNKQKEMEASEALELSSAGECELKLEGSEAEELSEEAEEPEEADESEEAEDWSMRLEEMIGST